MSTPPKTPSFDPADYVEFDEDIPPHILYANDLNVDYQSFNVYTGSGEYDIEQWKRDVERNKSVYFEKEFEEMPGFNPGDVAERDADIPNYIPYGNDVNAENQPGPSGYTEADARRATEAYELEWDMTELEYWEKKDEERQQMEEDGTDKEMDDDN